MALLEQLANDVAGWPARAVEFYELLGWTQHVNHLRLSRGQTVDLRQSDALDKLDGPFDELAHTVDIRRVNSPLTQGCHNIPSVGLFVWRLKTYSVIRTPAYCDEEVGPYCYTFSVLGNDSPLYTYPDPETTHIADELNLPIPIRRRAFEERKLDKGVEIRQASADYYGLASDTLVGKSLAIWAPGWPTKNTVIIQTPLQKTAFYPKKRRKLLIVCPETAK